METSKNKHIDLTYLKELSNGSNEFITQIISIFMTQTPEELEKMEKSLNAGNWDAVRATAHKIKPSFLFMGIKELESVINSVEDFAAKKTNLDQLPEMITKIKTICEQALVELETEKKLFL